ncbi:MAG: NUDIX domain-containing protein [Candidatus Sungbacteria bacterium]|uniref:NUDIX domain-containing protein n=1 Tax=Candidatus Sungiibacteriota bacterium TaxID=2750080 RepID=A0A932VQW1_9BACT|nr:NUDIX domain-containing protein [Candidatus Sungbacteria bacterium]
MKNYTLGFIFTPSLGRVLLVHKLNPEWQAGKINGGGGKMEAGENPLTCIVREVREETGLITNELRKLFYSE